MAGLLAKSKTDKSDDCSLESKKPDLNVLQEAKQTEFLYKSLQQPKVEQNRSKQFGIKETTPKANRAKHAKLDGLIAVLVLPFHRNTKENTRQVADGKDICRLL